MAHPKVPHGKCPICKHHGDDCTGIEPGGSRWTLPEVAVEMSSRLGVGVPTAHVAVMLGRVLVLNEIEDCLRSAYDLPESDDSEDRP